MKLTTRITFGLAMLWVPIVCCPSDAQKPAPFYLHDGDTVVMYGDSITDQRLYTVDTEAAVLDRYPTWNINWIDSGWGGDRVEGGGGGNIDQRIARDVLPYKPNVVTIMLGMNDGQYSPFDQNVFNEYTTGYAHILDSISKGDPDVRFTLIQPSPFDDVTRAPRFPGGYNVVLIKYGQSLVPLAAQYKGLVVDFNTPMVAMLTAANASDPTDAPNIIGDRVHPSPSGHLVMMEALVKGWGMTPSVTDVVINGANGRVKAVNATVSHVVIGTSLSWSEMDGSLPLWIDPTDNMTALVLKSSDLVSAIDQEMLTVKNLPAPSYDLTIDSQPVATITSAALAGGVNLAVLPTPMLKQAAKVYQLTVQHQNIHAEEWRNVQVPFVGDPTPAVASTASALCASLNAEDQSIIAKQRQAALPVEHEYSLTPHPQTAAVAPAP